MGRRGSLTPKKLAKCYALKRICPREPVVKILASKLLEAGMNKTQKIHRVELKGNSNKKSYLMFK